MVNGKKETGLYKLKSLDKGSVVLIVIDRVHLDDKNIRMIGKKCVIVFISPSNQIFPVSPFFISSSLLFGELAGYLAAQVHDGNASDFMENILLDVVIKGLLGNAQFRVAGDDLVGGVSLFEQGSDNGGHCLCLLYGQVNAQPGVNKEGAVV